MRINLDFAKIYYSYKINTDARILNTVARNSTIPEELGRIQFLLSDKTGTLTKNDMIFRKLNLEYYAFTDENLDDIRMLLGKGSAKADIKFARKKGKRREQHLIVSDLFHALILCHNVTPVYTPIDEATDSELPDPSAYQTLSDSDGGNKQTVK